MPSQQHSSARGPSYSNGFPSSWSFCLPKLLFDAVVCLGKPASTIISDDQIQWQGAPIISIVVPGIRRASVLDGYSIRVFLVRSMPRSIFRQSMQANAMQQGVPAGQAECGTTDVISPASMAISSAASDRDHPHPRGRRDAVVTEFGRAFQWRIGVTTLFACIGRDSKRIPALKCPQKFAGRQHQSRGRIRDLTPEGSDASTVLMTMKFALAKEAIGASAKWSDGWKEGIEERHGLKGSCFSSAGCGASRCLNAHAGVA